MTNSELINAYLDNELNDADRLRFEERLSQEPALKQELALHQDIIEGIGNARKAQLKNRLNQVDVGGNAGWSTAQVVGTVVLVAAGIAAIYFLYPSAESTDANKATTNEITTTERPVVAQSEEDLMASEEKTETVDEDLSAPVETEEITSAQDDQPADEEELVTENEERQPEDKRPVVAPSFDNEDAERVEVTAPDGAVLGEVVTGDTRVDVEVIRNMPNRDFHYAFEDNTLRLYGNFDADLYEIIEFNSDKGKRWFLSYQDRYYSLDSSASGIMPLKEITDNKLLDVLKNIR